MGGMKDFAKLVVQQTATAKTVNEVKAGIADIKKQKKMLQNLPHLHPLLFQHQ